MILKRNLNTVLFAVFASVLILSCNSSDQKTEYVNPEVTVWELSDADMLNPFNYSDAGAGYIMTNIFQKLLSIDFNTLELVPILATERPEIIKTPEGGMLITYTIRPDAKWDNGTPITAKDIEFSLKVMKNPKVNNQRLRPYYEFIQDVQFYEQDPLKLTFICKDVYILAEAASGDFSILPENIFDPKGLMKGFSIRELSENAEKISDDPKIVEFANDFNSEKYQREKEFVIGSGAYTLEEWLTGQRIVLKKKENWWGNKLAENNKYFEVNSPKIIYQTINDQTTGIVALKAGNIDLARTIKAKDFVELPKSEKFTANYVSHTPGFLEYNYIGINTKLENKKLSDKKVRQALAHLFDVPKIIEIIQYGLAQRIIGPIHPSDKKAYNKDLAHYQYSVETAKKLLSEAGWKDSNGNGTVDKVIDGELVELEITFTYNSGNDERKGVALMFQEEARKAGIKVNVIAQEWSIYLDNLKSHKFDMYFGAWVSTPVPADHKQIYHTESYHGGSNYTGFGNDESDALIDAIRIELDEDKRALLNKEFQKILHDQVSYIFLYARNEKIAINKRFHNAQTSVMRPGYWESGFSVTK
ncbi:MAG: ABC transporter substrate-binding protein [Bacteroidetes bacterium]|nr:ABC transporter substrate-binding protein [Bacteroidota bacterium]HET6245138.1 ABC transporter substrate-binding protein [Bacteroidia bacterium]